MDRKVVGSEQTAVVATLHPLDGPFGMAVEGIDLSKVVASGMRHALNKALVEQQSVANGMQMVPGCKHLHGQRCCMRSKFLCKVGKRSLPIYMRASRALMQPSDSGLNR